MCEITYLHFVFQKGTSELLKYLRSRIQGTYVAHTCDSIYTVCDSQYIHFISFQKRRIMLDVWHRLILICPVVLYIEQPDGCPKDEPKTAMTLPSQARINVHSIKTLKTLDYRYTQPIYLLTLPVLLNVSLKPV